MEFLASIPDEIRDQVAFEIDNARGQSESERVAGYINAKTAAAQEIGPLPDIGNPQRRERCERDNLLFAETYFKPTFYLPWAPYQRTMMDRFQSVILNGGRECHAVRRGGLKSTCARVSTLWAVVNGHRRFPVLSGATDDKASEHRTNFFDMLQSSDLLLEDYPELLPLLLKRKQPKKQFRLDGRLLEVHPKDDKGRIVFPDIYDSKSCQARIAPYSVNATDVSGLAYVDRFGVTIRPDIVVYDDVQTPQSAKSSLLTDDRENKIVTVFGGLKGLGEDMAQIMVCTVRGYGDLSERFLDRKLHPDWNGHRYPSILRMPDDTEKWDEYAKLLSCGATAEEGKAMAQAYYVANHEAMKVGGEVAWEEDKLPGEVDALQSLMTIKILTPDFFRTDIQQIGLKPVDSSGLKLEATELITRLSHVPRGIVPSGATYLTAFIDSSDEVLWWMVMAWTPGFSGWIVDYGTWPDQERPVFLKSDLPRTISGEMPGVSWEEAFVHAHNELEHQLLGREWFSESGEPQGGISLVLKDWADGEHKPRIKSQVMASSNRPFIRPSKGVAPKPGRKPVHAYGDQHRDRHNNSQWVERRTELPHHVQFHANQWKSHGARRLLTTVGAPSAVTLPGDDEYANRLLVEHLSAEIPKQIVYDGTPGVVWELTPGRDNDWFDCYYGNNIAASMLGCALPGESEPAKNHETFALPGAR